MATFLPMTLTTLLAAHGLVIVFLGALVEGEAVLLLAGAAAHHGLLPLPAVILAAFAGSLVGDQLAFELGRRHGDTLRGSARWQPKLARLDRFLRGGGRRDLLAVGFRFVYGLRIAAPVGLALVGMPRQRFLLLNLAGAALWAPAIAGLGWALGHAALALFGSLERALAAVLVLALIVSVVVGVWRRRTVARAT